MGSHTVYRFYDAQGDVLYVGCTSHLPNRIDSHRSDKTWWTDVARIECEHFPDRARAFAREYGLILELKPRHAAGHASYEGDGIPCAFGRYCGDRADRAYAVYVGPIGRAEHRRVYHVCPDHDLEPRRAHFLTWFADTEVAAMAAAS